MVSPARRHPTSTSAPALLPASLAHKLLCSLGGYTAGVQTVLKRQGPSCGSTTLGSGTPKDHGPFQNSRQGRRGSGPRGAAG